MISNSKPVKGGSRVGRLWQLVKRLANTPILEPKHAADVVKTVATVERLKRAALEAQSIGTESDKTVIGARSVIERSFDKQ